MSTATSAPARRQTPRATTVMPRNGLRLLRTELRRNAMPWMLPLIAVLFWFDSYRPSVSTAPLYALRTFWNMGQGHALVDFAPFVAGVAAWMGSRDGRRGLADLVTATARPRWAAQLTTWAATAIWAVAAYLVFVGVMFAMYAHQGVSGTPPWWWVAAGATAVAMFSAAGFAIGAWWPSRFAAPAAAFGTFLALFLSFRAGFTHTSGWSMILPTNSNGNFQADSGIFYPWLPDLPIARIMFLAGIAAAALGLTGLPARAGGPWLRRAAAAVTLAGVAATGTAVGLASTAQLSAHGMVIPALHDAASDAPITYTPACDRTAGVPVCVNPAYRRWLPDLTAALAPVLAAVAGLPGAPARVTQVAGAYSSGEIELLAGQAVTISGRPPVLRMPLDTNNLPGKAAGTATAFADEVRLLAVHAFTGAGNRAGNPAQQAVQAALLQHTGLPFVQQPKALSLVGPPTWEQPTLLGLTGGPGSASGPSEHGPGRPAGPIYAAARRFAALPATTRHAWLTAHLAALRAGQLTLGDLP